MEELITKRVRVVRPDFNPALDGRPGTVVRIGDTSATAGLLGVRLDKHYLTMGEAQECSEAADEEGRDFDPRIVWLEPSQIEVVSC